MQLMEEFRRRGLLYDATEGLAEVISKESMIAYAGFDPSARSLHVGNLLPIMCLARLQRAGHTPIALLGGGTGLIGDPSGKTKERRLLSKEEVARNVEGIREQLTRFLDFESGSHQARLIDNADWLASIPLIDFLRDVGKHFTVNTMLAKESVKRRLEQEEGISYTEFSYMLLQAYDFLVLHRREGCNLQVGGSDQWGNITAGVELIRREEGHHCHGLVFPLVMSSSGVKFGKTEEGSVWLDAEWTSPYRFYQFWLNTDDRDAVTYLKYFTWLSGEQIEALEGEVAERPERREAQKRLAAEVTEAVHGPAALQRALQASEVLFGAEIAGLSAVEVEEIFSDVPSSAIGSSRLDGGIPLVDLMLSAQLAKSKGEARRLIQGGGVYVNNRRVSDVHAAQDRQDFIEGRFLILRRGAKTYGLVRVE